MSRVRCTCRSHCLTFNPETRSYEGEGQLVPRSTAANHRRDDISFQTLDSFTQDIATQVLGLSPPPEILDHHPTNPIFDDQDIPPRFHDQSSSDDLYFILEVETSHRCAWAPGNRSLVFILNPPPTLPYEPPTASEILIPNRAPYSLDPQNPTNRPYLENESRLCEILMTLERRPVSDTRDRLLARAYEGLAMMNRHKEVEWNRQRAGSIAHHHGYSVVNTGIHKFSVAWNIALIREHE